MYTLYIRKLIRQSAKVGCIFIIVIISDSNWTEWSTIQGVIGRVISNPPSTKRKPKFVSEGDLPRITVPLSISGLALWIFILFIYFLATTSLLEHMPAKLPITLED